MSNRSRKGLSFQDVKQDRALARAKHAAYIRKEYAENQDYRRSKQAANAVWMRSDRAKQRDIAPFPLEINWERRLACKNDLKLFNETYLGRWKDGLPAKLANGEWDKDSGIFYKPWSKDQLICINRTETVIIKGGKFAVAMPRAGGKTAIIRGGTLWGALYNWRRFIVNIGSKETTAISTLQMVKTQMENNPLIRQDFPEVCWAAFCLEGSNHLSRRQIYMGEPTFIDWADDSVRFPYILFPTEVADHYLEHDPSSIKFVERFGRYVNANGGVILHSAGIDAAIRGDAEADPIWLNQPRPDLVILDDVQKDQKADSPLLCEKLIRLIDGAVTGLAGGGQHIDILMPCTVIREGDVADTYLDPLKKPDFKGVRCQMVESWPEGITNHEISMDTPAGKHWNKYSELRRISLRDHQDIHLATEYYEKNRKVMNRGFVTSWVERYDSRSEISSQQHAMNLRLQNQQLFLAEYQNIGRQIIETVAILITAAQLAEKTVETKRGQLAPAHQYIVNFMDIQDEIYYYLTFSCDQDFNGTFIDYGTWPDVKTPYFNKSQTASWGMITSLFFQVPEHAKYKSKAFRNSDGRIRAPLEAKLYWGLSQATSMLLNRTYQRVDTSRTQMKIQVMGIDCRWGDASEAIKRFIRESGNDKLVPCYGAPFPPTNRQLEEYEKRDGWFFENMLHPNVREPAWVFRPNQGDGMIYMQNDVNRLKDRLFRRLGTPMGASGCITLHSAPKEYHELFVNHICNSEYPEPVTARAIAKNMWVAREGSAYDNDWLDCAVGCIALASAKGASLKTADMEMYKPVRRHLSDIAARKRQQVPEQRIRLSRRGRS